MSADIKVDKFSKDTQLVDKHGRVIDYIRISVTDAAIFAVSTVCPKK